MRETVTIKVEEPQYSVVTGMAFSQVDAWFGHTRRDLKMDIIYPEDQERLYPCIVWICGGAWVQMDKSAHLAYLTELARTGFVVASVEYRTSNEGPYPMPLIDIKAGIRYLRAHSERFRIDPEHFGVIMNNLIDRVKAAYVAEGHKADTIKNIEVYIKVDENMAYYVIDGYASGISL